MWNKECKVRPYLDKSSGRKNVSDGLMYSVESAANNVGNHKCVSDMNLEEGDLETTIVQNLESSDYFSLIFFLLSCRFLYQKDHLKGFVEKSLWLLRTECQFIYHDYHFHDILNQTRLASY